jgi:glucokinase
MKRRVALGADIGGSHITAALVDLNNKQLSVHSLSRDTNDTNAGVDDLLKGWAGCIAKAMGNAPIEKICLAMPGPFRYDEGICLIKDQNKYPGLYGVNVRQRLSEALDLDRSAIYLHNDAACFLQGEVFSGSISGIKRAIGLTLGTGLGTAVYKNGIAESADRWNMPFKDSIAEDYISSRWFTGKYFELTGNTINGVKELVNHAHTDERIRQIFQEFGVNLAAFINSFIESEDPEAVIIGGNISNAFPFFSEILLTQVRKIYPGVRIYKSVQGENAALIGAVSSWYNFNKRSMAD